jgi:hypothetical protein
MTVRVEFAGHIETFTRRPLVLLVAIRSSRGSRKLHPRKERLVSSGALTTRGSRSSDSSQLATADRRSPRGCSYPPTPSGPTHVTRRIRQAPGRALIWWRRC